MRIDQLQRAHNADPQSEQAKTKLTIQRARTEGPQVYLERLMDRELWNRTNPGLQEHAAREVARRLGDQFAFEGMRDWSCPVQHWTECKACKGEKGRHSERAGRWIGCFYCQEKGRVCLRIPESHSLALFTRKHTGIEFNLLPGFEYWENDPLEMKMDGMTHEQEKHFERNRRQVKRTVNPFLIARWPVTYGQMIRRASLDISGREDYFSEAGDEDLPYTGLSFSFLEEHLPKVGFSLPTPEQWEYACRAGTSTRFYWGDKFDSSYCWYDGNCTVGTNVDGEVRAINHGPHSPKEHDDAEKWNAFGLVDTLGNVFEWISDGSLRGDCYRSDPILSSIDVPTRPFPGLEHEIGFRPVVAVPVLED